MKQEYKDKINQLKNFFKKELKEVTDQDFLKAIKIMENLATTKDHEVLHELADIIAEL